MTSEGHIL